MVHTSVIAIPILVAASTAATVPQPGTYYQYGQLGISKAQLEGQKINLTFKPIAERSYWCPGVSITETKKALIVTFVRCETYKTCPVDLKAKIGKRLIRTISIDTRGKDTYVRTGPKKFKRIYKVKKAGGSKKNTPPRPKAVKNKTIKK